ncbi:hypothetical protein D9M71_833510 [compost metagenome]
MGEILPLTLIAGGMPAVMKRSDAFWCAISLRNEVKSMVVLVVFMAMCSGNLAEGRAEPGAAVIRRCACPWRIPWPGCA